MMVPVPVSVSVSVPGATTRRLHKRNDYYHGPNLGVLIPVIVILILIAAVFFGWFGVPWPRIMAWWKRKRTRPVATTKDDHVQDQELEHPPPPGSRLSFAKAFERSHMDALKLSNIGADPKAKSSKAVAAPPPAPTSPTETRPSGTLTPDMATGQMTPGQQSTLSAVPDRSASPWDPTRAPD